MLLLGACSTPAGSPQAIPDPTPTGTDPSPPAATAPASPSPAEDLDAVTADAPGPDWTPADATPPTDALTSFRFDAELVEAATDASASDVSMRAEGVAVTPDAVTCDLTMGSEPFPLRYETTVIAEHTWTGDNFIRTASEERQTVGDDLHQCPGAAEYWEEPFFLRDPFRASYAGPGEDVEGLATSQFTLTTADPDIDIDEGSLWVAAGGIPVRVELTGTAVGGIGRLLDPSLVAPADTDPTPVRFGLRLWDLDAPALVVRAPDGSTMAGPTGPVEPSLSPPAPLSDALTAEVSRSRAELCTQYPTFDSDGGQFLVIDIPAVDRHQARPTELELGGISVRQLGMDLPGPDGEVETLDITSVFPGMAWGGSPASPVVTQAEGELALVHAYLLFNHRAPLIAFMDFTGRASPEWVEDGRVLTVLAKSGASAGDEPERLAWLDGAALALHDDLSGLVDWPQDIGAPFWSFMALPMTDRIPAQAVVDEALKQLDVWQADLDGIAPRLRDGDLQAAADLAVLFENRAQTRSLICIALSAAWAETDASWQGGGRGGATVEAAAHELSIQHMALALEYVEALSFFLERPEVDWLRSPDIVLATQMGQPDTAGTYITFFTQLLEEALHWSHPSSYQ